jgi:hypothetical protein
LRIIGNTYKEIAILFFFILELDGRLIFTFVPYTVKMVDFAALLNLVTFVRGNIV